MGARISYLYVTSMCAGRIHGKKALAPYKFVSYGPGERCSHGHNIKVKTRQMKSARAEKTLFAAVARRAASRWPLPAFPFRTTHGKLLRLVAANGRLPRKRHSIGPVGPLAWIMTTDVDQLSELMRRYGRGDDGAFARVYEMLAPRLYRFCRRLTTHKTDADDLFQETFFKLHRSRATYMPGANALHWAFAIARSVSLDRLRYRRRRREDLGSANDVAEDDSLRADDSHHPEAELFAHALVEVVTLELGKMSEKNRAAYVLLREEGLSVKEAAALLGTTTEVVKQRSHRACEQLRGALGAAGWREHGTARA
jgi:RNA polymerase sigma-70 factor, ECF subfamily